MILAPQATEFVNLYILGWVRSWGGAAELASLITAAAAQRRVIMENYHMSQCC